MTDPNRKDRVGEWAPWPKGQTRNHKDPRWNSLRKDIVKELKAGRDFHQPAGSNVRSGAYIADLCGVTKATVSKWLSGANYPPTHAIDAMELWYFGL